MRALILIDHGSRRDEANRSLEAVVELVQATAGDGVRVFAAHMELASPTIAEAMAACVAAGATEVIAVPYMLAMGRHAAEDIPRLVAEAARAHGVEHRVTEPLGVHPALAQLVLERAGLGG
jgi:sirohydrochlorin ferrochelatase